MAAQYPPETVDRICEQLEEGKSLALICQEDGMPGRSTVYRWLEGDDVLAERIYRAREVGFHFRAEKAVEDAKAATDPIAGRLAFDAERWYLGKLSNAFRDKPLLGVQVNVGDHDAFDTFARQLEEARASAAGRAISTSTVDIPSPSGPDHPAGRLAHMAGAGGERLGQDEDGR